MANVKRRYPENVSGDFFVDDTCIDCDLCRQIAPSVCLDAGDYSVVYHQPANPTELRRAEMSLIACPTGSIGTQSKRDLSGAIKAFPEPVEDNVYFCGYASPHSY